MRLKASAVSSHSALRLVGIALLAGTAAGCSSDASRFMYRATDNLTTASIGEPAQGRLQPAAEIPGTAGSASAPASVSQAYPGDYRQPGAETYSGSARAASSSSTILSGQPSVARTSLPPAGATQGVSAAQSAARIPVGPATAPVTQPFPPSPAERAAAAKIAQTSEVAPDPVVTGTTPRGGNRTVVVQSGETLTGIARRFGVPASEIMRANGIADASRIRSGQILVIPGGSAPQPAKVADTSRGNNPAPAPAQPPARDVAVLPTAPTVRNMQGSPAQTSGAENGAKTAAAKPETPAKPATVASAASGTYAVQSGDTLTKIARKHGVSVDALKSANNLSGASLRIGQKLVIPTGATTSVPDPVTTASVKATSPKPQAYAAPEADTGKDTLAETAKADTESKAPASTGIDKLRWPARGQVITGYAQKTDDGKRNDGIDISMPVGSPVKAAENGVVIYSGDGLKEYGNTVLVRHDNGLVTVYANADQLNVKRGDKVQRGQVIASSGMSGNAKTPRLHFEVRKNATPVDPTTYLE
jgi:Membrane proteins related to metalloendopeptidases